MTEPRLGTAATNAIAIRTILERLDKLDVLASGDLAASIAATVSAELQPLRDRIDAQQDGLDQIREDLQGLRIRQESHQNWISDAGEKLPKLESRLHGLEVSLGHLKKKVGGEDGAE